MKRRKKKKVTVGDEWLLNLFEERLVLHDAQIQMIAHQQNKHLGPLWLESFLLRSGLVTIKKQAYTNDVTEAPPQYTLTPAGWVKLLRYRNGEEA